MSGDTRFDVVMKGVSHGACDFLSKPVRMEELQNIWQHVVRRKWLDNKDIEHSGSVGESELNRNVTDDSEYASTVNDGRDSSWKYQKKKRDAKEDDDGELDSVDPSSSKKPRVVWSVELHQQFVNAVNQLGIDSMNILNSYVIKINKCLCLVLVICVINTNFDTYQSIYKLDSVILLNF